MDRALVFDRSCWWIKSLSHKGKMRFKSYITLIMSEWNKKKIVFFFSFLLSSWFLHTGVGDSHYLFRLDSEFWYVLSHEKEAKKKVLRNYWVQWSSWYSHQRCSFFFGIPPLLKLLRRFFFSFLLNMICSE